MTGHYQCTTTEMQIPGIWQEDDIIDWFFFILQDYIITFFDYIITLSLSFHFISQVLGFLSIPWLLGFFLIYIYSSNQWKVFTAYYVFYV